MERRNVYVKGTWGTVDRFTDPAAEVGRYIIKEKMILPGDMVVVAVSGGPDSMALLHILSSLLDEYKWRLVVAHVNHGFRPQESAQEAELVEEFTRKLGLPCEIAVLDLPAYIAETAMNGQAAAREKRYAFLHEVAAGYGAKRIALAHHMDDQAETVLMRLLRGTGPAGLAGMPERRTEKNVELIRPLLRMKKEALIAYCHERQIPYCIDSSNAKRKYFRNEIRLDALPFLRRYNDQLPEALGRLAETMREEDRYMEQEARKAMNRLVAVREESVTGESRSVANMTALKSTNGRRDCVGQAECSLLRSDYIQLAIALQRRLIKLILNYLVLPEELLDFTKLETIREAIVQQSPTTLSLDLYRNIRFIREYDDIRFVRLDSFEDDAAGGGYADPPFEYRIDAVASPYTLDVPEANAAIMFRVLEREPDETPEQWRIRSAADRANEARFDLDRLLFPLAVRNRRDGDRIEPIGLNGSKKVKNMFIDAKVPPRLRNRIPLLVDQGCSILWVPGFRRSRHAPADDDTVRILHVTVESKD
jgi:tRNA(Ile)-lysidine synthase